MKYIYYKLFMGPLKAENGSCFWVLFYHLFILILFITLLKLKPKDKRILTVEKWSMHELDATNQNT